MISLFEGDAVAWEKSTPAIFTLLLAPHAAALQPAIGGPVNYCDDEVWQKRLHTRDRTGVQIWFGSRP